MAMEKTGAPVAEAGTDASTEYPPARKNSPEAQGQIEAPPAQPPRDVTGIRWALVVLSILSSTFLFSLDNTIVADVQPAIVREFDSVDKLAWLPVAFLLGAASSNLFWGQCYAKFNAKYMYIFCVTLFETGSAICGAAPSFDALIVGRSICGLGGAGMYTGVMVLISATTLEHERPLYFGFTGLTWGTGTILGPILGGVFTDSAATWRWAFFINLVVGGVFAPVYLFLLPSLPVQSRLTPMQRLKSIDFVGTVLLGAMFATFIIAASFGGTLFRWNSGTIIGLFVAAGVLLLIFIAQQLACIGTSADNRLFPVSFLRSPIMIMAFLATASASVAIFVPVYFVPLYFQFVRNDSALTAGVQLLPFVVFNVAAAMVNGGVMSKVPYYMPWYVFAGATCTVGSALMLTVDASTAAANIWGYTILLGAGSGAFVQLSFTVVQSKVAKAALPVAIGFLTLAQLAGPAFALCIANAVFLNQATSGIQAIAPQLPAERIFAAISGASSSRIPDLDPAQQARALSIVVSAMSNSYALSLAAGALTLVMAAFMKRERLPLGTKQDASN